ncbi:MAG: cadherin repeat domain-containing protein, partial [Hydrogenophaga sp.]
ATGDVIVAQDRLDFEDTSLFRLTVSVTDNAPAPLTATATATIRLTDVNERPTIQAAALTVDENSLAGVLAGRLTATDPDAGDSVRWAITGGNTGGAFSVHQVTGELRVARVLDYLTLDEYRITVSATDTGGLWAHGSVTVNILDVNEPPVVHPGVRRVDENLPPGALVGAPVEASDPDFNQLLTFSITAGNGQGRFKVNPCSGQLYTEALLDY